MRPEPADIVLSVCNSFGYDEFNRLTARTVYQGTVQNFTYTFDRYGNRWAQNAPQGYLFYAEHQLQQGQ